jgi:hypothetical protein
VEYRELDPSRNDAYADLLVELWAEGADSGFAIVEQDIQVHAGVLPAWGRCRHRWCGFGYIVGYQDFQPGVYLGCTRFSDRVVRDHPDVMVEACSIDNDGLAAKDWRRMDVRVDKVLRSWGERPVMHSGQVRHLHYQEAF